MGESLTEALEVRWGRPEVDHFDLQSSPPARGSVHSATISSTGHTEPCSYLSHDLVNLKRQQGGRFFFQLRTPCKKDSGLARFRWWKNNFVGDLLYRSFPWSKIHRTSFCDAYSLEPLFFSSAFYNHVSGWARAIHPPRFSLCPLMAVFSPNSQ